MDDHPHPRHPDNPAWCREGSDHPYARYFPIDRAGRHTSATTTRTPEDFTLIDTCFGTHHLQFAEDADDTLYFSGGGPVIGWLDTKVYDETGDERPGPGLVPDGHRHQRRRPHHAAVERTGAPGQPRGRRRSTRRSTPGWWRAPTASSPTRSTTRCGLSPTAASRAACVRLDRGDNPPETCIAELYSRAGREPRTATGRAARHRRRPQRRALDGAVGQRPHGQLRPQPSARCSNGPEARDSTASATPAGPSTRPRGPRFPGSTDIGSADFHYYNWVDQFDTLGLGENIPIANGSSSDSLLALDPATGDWTVLRVPYPQGFHSRGLDGRIDDPDAGWKGRGVYATYGADAAWHVEGGPVEPGNLVKFQIRPDPLAH